MTWLPAAVSVAALLLVIVTLMRVMLVLDRIEAAARLVASNLVVAQTAVDGVAKDLHESHGRANASMGVPGEAADEAARKP